MKNESAGTGAWKVVYREGPDAKVKRIIGAISEDGEFVRVTNSKGTMTLNRQIVLSIKKHDEVLL